MEEKNRSVQEGGQTNYVTRLLRSPSEIEPGPWNELLELQSQPTPFMRHEYLLALHDSGSAHPQTGWAPCFITLWCDDILEAACPVYLKTHSYGEYVFDWSWASAYKRHGLDYYPKCVVAVPFTPVTGSRLLARSEPWRAALVDELLRVVQQLQASSLHVLFASDDELQACQRAGLMLRHTVQFHWTNALPGYRDFDHFLNQLTQEKRKKIRQERRKVREAGVQIRCSHGRAIATADWEFFYQCYCQTYAEHGNPPYLSKAFFLQHMAQCLPESWLLFMAERDGRPIATSLIAIDPARKIAYGRYWGALERVDCLHFDLCYYQPIEWCIEHGYERFEGGAQGEHKLSRALLPVRSSSAHWIVHAGFAQAVARALNQEQEAVGDYMAELELHQPFKQTQE